jgi:hypothetical protein
LLTNGCTLQVSCHHIGKRVYIEATRGGDPGLLSFADDVVVDRGALLLAHSGTNDSNGINLSFQPLTLGANCVVGSRRVFMPSLSLAEKQAVPAGELLMAAAK